MDIAKLIPRIIARETERAYPGSTGRLTEPVVQSTYLAFDSDGEFMGGANTMRDLVILLLESDSCASVIELRQDHTWDDRSHIVALAYRDSLVKQGFVFSERGDGDAVPGFLWLHLTNAEICP